MWQSLPRPNKSLAWLASLLLAVLITQSLFYLMSRLINPSDQVLETPAPLYRVDVSQVRTPERKQQQSQLQEKTLPPVPDIPVAETSPYSLSIPKEVNTQSLLLTEPKLDAKEFSVEQQYWSAPVAGGAGQGQADYLGQADTGRKEIVPIATRRPNIPKVAYDNRINGWVLLAFTVTNDGKISNIRVLDAEPRGVFEANAVAAVKTWMYAAFKGPERHISQKITFEWNMYSYNMDYY
jgi:periplasmic protein TonB